MITQLYKKTPLYVQIIISLVVAVFLGPLLGGGNPNPDYIVGIKNLAIPSSLVLKALRTLATPLILLAVLHSFLTAEISGKAGRRLLVFLLTNTTVAIIIGLLVANILQPGRWYPLTASKGTATSVKTFDPWGLLQDLVPDSVLKPIVDNNVLQLIFIALAFGIILRILKEEQIQEGKKDYLAIEQVIDILFQAVVRIINFCIQFVPLAVLGIVAKTVALQGFAPFKSLGAFIIAVLLALVLQGCYYLIRLRFGSWVSPKLFLTQTSDALLTAFSTSSSTVTMPVTFKVLTEKVGLKEASTSLGVLVGGHFNHDGTALYEAMSALFITQVIGSNLSLPQQLVVVLTSIFASVGAAGIPEAGLVTMTLVFTSVGLPTEYIVLLVTVDWFLDRCRTAINVMGDMTVSCLLEGKVSTESKALLK